MFLSFNTGFHLQEALYQGERKVSFTAKVAVNMQPGLTEEDVALLGLEPCSHLAKVTRLYDMLEPHVVNSAVQCGMPLYLILDKKCATLRHYLALDHSGHYRISGEMSPAEKLVFPYPIPGMRHALRVYIDFIYKKHRFAMRKIFLQFVSVHFVCRFNRLKYNVGQVQVRDNHPLYFLNATHPLWPPNPRESDIAIVSGASAA